MNNGMFGRIWIRYRKQIFIVVLFALPVLPLLLIKVELPRLNVYDTVSSFVVHPVAELGTNFGRGVSKIWGGYFNLVNVSQDNQKLKDENQELRNQLLTYDEVKIENQRLNRLLELKAPDGFFKKAAKIIGQDVSSESLSFVINIGSRHGVQLRDPVITPEGVAGTVKRVYPFTSVFTAIADPSHHLDAFIPRSRARFIVEGRSFPLAGRLKYLDRSEDVRVGDRVLTSGLDGVFPRGVLVGSIIKVNRPKTGILQDSELRSAVDFGKIEEVIVLSKSSDQRLSLKEQPQELPEEFGPKR